MFNNLYLFLRTNDSKIYKRLNTIIFKKKYQNGLDTFYLSNMEDAEPRFLSVINNQDDFSINQIVKNLREEKSHSLSYDSLVSFSLMDDSYFFAQTDFWGIQQHYWFKDEDTFICSNNVFIIAKLLSSKISEYALFEYFFFLAPLNEHTWFEKINALHPNQALLYNLKDNSLKLTPEVDLRGELLKKNQSNNLIDTVSKFYLNASRHLNTKKSLISLSSGSDSRTVLSGLMKYNLLDKAVCFGREDFLETRAICRLAENLNIKLQMFNFNDLLLNWPETFLKSSFLTNGLLNPFRVHYANYYSSLNGCSLFEGILGSEFIKGEIAIGAMMSQCHKDVISHNKSISEAININLNFLSKDFRLRMDHYISDNYSERLRSVNTKEGREGFLKFSLHFIPAKIFSAIILLAKENMDVYYPFLSPLILSNIFKSSGVAQHSTIDIFFPGPIRCIRIEAEIVKSFSDKLYKSVLDRGISFKEALESPLFLTLLFRHARLRFIKLFQSKYYRGQVDLKQLAEPVKQFVEQNNDFIDTTLWDNKLMNFELIKRQANLIAISKILTKDFSDI